MEYQFKFQNTFTKQKLSATEFRNYLIKKVKNPFIICNSDLLTQTTRINSTTSIVTGIGVVILEQYKILKKLGYTPILLNGTSNFEDKNCFILPIIASGIYEPILNNFKKYFEKHKNEILEMINILEPLKTIPFIAHNTTNSTLHNPIFGHAIAKIIENGCKLAILHSYDIRGAKTNINYFLPHPKSNFKIITGSKVTKEQIQYFAKRNYSDKTLVLPTPINIKKFKVFTKLPDKLG